MVAAARACSQMSPSRSRSRGRERTQRVLRHTHAAVSAPCRPASLRRLSPAASLARPAARARPRCGGARCPACSFCLGTRVPPPPPYSLSSCPPLLSSSSSTTPVSRCVWSSPGAPCCATIPLLARVVAVETAADHAAPTATCPRHLPLLLPASASLLHTGALACATIARRGSCSTTRVLPCLHLRGDRGDDAHLLHPHRTPATQPLLLLLRPPPRSLCSPRPRAQATPLAGCLSAWWRVPPLASCLPCH